MEDYHTFVQHCLSQLKKITVEEEELRPSSAHSLIRFCGRPILPPLLSGKQREEMRQHRDKVQNTAVSIKVKDDPRMAYVQTILHSVQLRKTPTLEELLQEAEIKANSSHHNNSSIRSVSHWRAFVGTKESLSLTPIGKLTNGVSLPPMTSTTYSAFCTSNLTPQQSHNDGCFTDQLDNQQGSQPCSFNGANHHLLSSGYVTSENVENITTVSGGIDSETESRAFGCSDDVHTTNGFFLHNASKTNHIMPDIISHPPIDGEELERSGLESSFSSDLVRARDIFCPSFHNDSVNHDHHLSEKSEHTYQHGMEHENNIPFSATYDPVNSGNKDKNEGQTTELHIQLNPSEAEDNQVNKEETKPSEEKTQSHPLSLQALLKKSQEYRRRQRMLRNEAKNTKIQERTQGQPRARTEEQSHSDKENDEFPYKGALTAEGNKAKERRGIFIPSVETSPLKSRDNEKMIESEVTGKKTNVIIESTHVIEDENNKDLTSAKEKTTLKNNKLNSSQEAITKPKQINAFVQQEPLLSETSLVQDAFYRTTCLKTFCTEGGKYHSVPTPNFSRSPVPCKSKGSVKLGQCVEGTETSDGKFVVSNLVEDKVEEVNLAHQNSHTAPPFTLNLRVEEDVTNVVAKSSQHIDQLESNLSSLKVLISDLESTVKENLDYHCQVDNNVQSESSFKCIKHSEQLHNNQHIELGQNAHFEVWEEKQRTDDDDDNSDMKCGEQSGTYPFLNLTNMYDHSGPQSHTNEADDDVLIDEESRTETVRLSQSKLVKSPNTERGKEKEMDKEVLIKHSQSGNCLKQKLPGKSILSVAQQMRIPNIFRNLPVENGALCVTSVLSDNSNHFVERESEMALEGHDSIHSPSLNQSYDVETPSDLWLQEDWGSDLYSQSCLSQDKHLTPESGNEDQGGKSKVKRRLLMHVTEDIREESLDTSRGVTSGVRPNSSTPRAALRWFEGRDNQRNKQEQVKRAHAAQVRALQDEHRKQQEELLQALAVRYRFLQNMSFPCSMSSSCLGDTVTFSTLSQQALSPLSQHYRPLLAAAVKGFLTRRLLRTERVTQLVRTIKDTQQFLRAFQQQSVGRGEFYSRQDVLLQDRVILQLRAARYEFYDIFFSLSAREQMQLISWDRELARERELKRQNGRPRGKTSLSAATQKSLERKRGMMIQKKTAERHMGVMIRTGQKSEFSVEKEQQIKRRQFRANPERVLRSACSSRPL